jgi:hypothetical protein
MNLPIWHIQFGGIERRLFEKQNLHLEKIWPKIALMHLDTPIGQH